MNTFKKLFLLFALHLFIFSCSSSSNSSSSSSPSSYSWQIAYYTSCENKSQTINYSCNDSSGKVVDDSLCTTINPTKNQSCNNYASIPSNNTLIDTIDDVYYRISDYKKEKTNTKSFIDLTSMFVNISDSKIEIKMTHKEIPAQLTFDHSKVKLNSSNYMWTIYFDIDDDDKLSVGDIWVKADYFKKTTTEFNGPLQNNLKSSIYECTKVENDTTSSQQISSLSNPPTLEVSGNTLTLTIDKTKFSGDALIKIQKIQKETTKVKFTAEFWNGEPITGGYEDIYPNNLEDEI